MNFLEGKYFVLSQMYHVSLSSNAILILQYLVATYFLHSEHANINVSNVINILMLSPMVHDIIAKKELS